MIENYQPVYIRTLLESPNYQATRDQIISKLTEANNNEDRDYGQIFWDVIYEVLKGKPNLVKYDKESKILTLIVDEKLSGEQESTLIELCNDQIAKTNSGNQTIIDPIKFQELHEKFLEEMKIQAQNMSVEPPNDEFTNFQHPYIAKEEIRYKREVVEKAQKDLSLEKWDEWKSEPSKIFDAVGKACHVIVDKKICGNLVSWRVIDNFFDKQKNDELINDIGKQFYNFFKGGSSEKKEFSVRLDNFIQFLKNNKLPVSSQLLAYLSFVLDPEQYTPIRIEAFEKLAKYYNCSREFKESFSWERYSVLLNMLEGVKYLLKEYGVPDTIEAHSYLWITSNLLTKMNDDNFWIVKPGTRGEDWENQKTNGVVGIGFVNADLSQFCKNKKYDRDKDGNSVSKLLKENGVESNRVGNFRSQLQWFMESQIGDNIVAWNGTTILGVGKIIGGYEYHNNEGYPHKKKVDWYDTNQRKIPSELYTKIQPVTHTFSEFPKHWKSWFQQGKEPQHLRVTKEGTGKLSDKASEIFKNISESKKHNLLLYGPPGTSKTFVIQEIMNYIKEIPFIDEFDTPVKIHWLTFHQGFSYEDFILGLRPKPTGTGFELKARAGILLESAIRIKEEGGSVVLFIDEINRANVSSVFGEFMTVMEPEKRLDRKGEDTPFTVPIRLAMINDGDEVELSDGSTRNIENPFKFPANIFVISTMNSLDRSVAPLDSALKRRFHIVNFPPDYKLLKDKLGLYHINFSNPKTPQETAIMLLQRINGFIEATLGDDFCLGHTYVWGVVDGKSDNAKWNALTDAWNNSIYPHLKELFRSQPDTLKSIIKFEDSNKPENYPYKEKKLDSKIEELDNAESAQIDETSLYILHTDQRQEFLKFIATMTKASTTT